MEQRSVAMVVPDNIYDLNDNPEAQYGVFGYTQGQHSVNGEMMTYAFSLFYVDRLNEDGSNKQMAQSVGIDTLTNVIYAMEEELPVSVTSATFDTFTERFSDDCAGVMASVSIVAPRNIVCPEN